MKPRFHPPLWEQRRICIAQTLYQQRAQSVVDVGCGEGNVLAFLASPGPNNEHPITQLFGVDVSADALRTAHERLQPGAADRRDLRVDPLSVRLFHGDAAVPVAGVRADAVVCSEVIEHVYERTGVSALTRAVLGGYRPALALFTTPNAEFNVNFPALGYGTPGARFRDADHKFEWTRAQFAAWAGAAAREFGYTVELRGIGLAMRNAAADFAPCGGCTQMAVFARLPGAGPAVGAVTGDPPRPLPPIDYPAYTQPQLGAAALLALVRGVALDIGDGPRGFRADRLWSVLEVQQQFKRRRALEAWLGAQPAFTRQPDGAFTVNA
ncbi:hypothetical protein LPJ63_001189 [Coemansia sp. RSA 2711]|nr:hypothetical protein LPJ63_001189 [Coemansia sp. RSA 2711]